MPGLFVGLDLGGSGTRAVLVDASGAVLASGQGPPAGYALGAAGRRGVARSLSAALSGIAPHVGAEACAVWAGTTGLSIPGRREWLTLELTTRMPGARVEVSSDAHIAVIGALGSGPGVAVLAGTGSIAMARSADGQLARAGGWGYLLGDEGSAYWLGREAVRASLDAVEGRASAGALTRLVHEVSGTNALISWVNGAGSPVARLANLAPLVSQAGDQGDDVARDILCRAGEALAATGMAAARQLSLTEPVRVVCVGGVWSAGHRLRDAFAKAWHGAHLEEPMLPPVLGAVLLAMGGPSPAVVARLSSASRTASSAS
jgi:glucosamine kinase